MADLLRVSQRGLILPGRKPSLMRLPRGITAYWPLDAANCEFSASGGQVRPLDLVGNNYGSDAKSMGATGLPPYDQGGIGFNFDATTNTYIVLNSDPLQGTTGANINATLAIWAYFNSFTGSGGAPRPFNFATQITCGPDDGTQIPRPAGTFFVDCAATSTGKYTSSALLSLNSWTHIAATISAGVCTAIYINGVSASLTSAFGAFSGSATNNIGCRDSASRILNGKLAHAVVCNGTVLTADEIADLYYSAFVPDEVMPALFVAAAGGFIPAWAINSNLPVIGTGTY